MPFSSVFESRKDINKVINIPVNIINVKSPAAVMLCKIPKLQTKNMDNIAINVGNLPLHGTKLFVKIAINLSLGESIMRHPVTPAALHPKPIHMVKEIYAMYDRDYR